MSLLNNIKNDSRIKNTLLRSVLMLIVGIVLTLNPSIATSMIMTIASIALVVYGAFMVFGYFRSGVGESDGMLSRGLISITAALVCWIAPDALLALVPILIGFVLMMSGVEELERAISLRRMSYPRWHLIMAFSVVILILGLLIVFNPFSSLMTLIRFIGVSMAVSAVLEIVGSLMYGDKKQ